MKKTKRTIAVLTFAILMMATMILSGCSSDTAIEGGRSTTETKKEETKEEADEPEKAVEVSGIVNVWTWEPIENQQLVINDFYKSFPEIEIVFTNVDGSDMPMKIQTALAANSELPDVVWSEISQRGKMLSFDVWEDLSQAPYHVSTSDLLDFTIPLSTTASGKLVGLEVAPPMSGLAYKRDLAIEYFGTDDPAELQEMFPTWESLIEAGKNVLEKSDGEVFMFSTLSEISSVIQGQNPVPFITDGKLNLEPAFGDLFNQLIEFKKAGIVDILDPWTPAGDASFAEKTNIFNYCPNWAPTWIFKAKAPDETIGNWALMVPPGGGCQIGGTNVLIPSKAENKLAAFEYIKWNYLSVEGATSNRDNLQYFSVYKPVYDDPSFYSAPDVFFGGQDVLQIYAQVIMPNMAPARPVNQYDIEVNDAATLAIKTISDSDGIEITTEQLIADMTAEITNKVPELGGN